MPLTTSIILTFFIIIIITPTSSLPLRHVGSEKHIARPVGENRDLILCWVVQIRTNARKCGCSMDEVDEGDGDDGGGSSDADGTVNEADVECCSSHKQIREHISVLSEEVGLEIHHIFGQFHDHFLLCHTETNETEKASLKNPPFTKSTSYMLSQLHQRHLALKSKDRSLFDLYQEDIQNRLRDHEEIVWFCSEHVHHHQSRTIVPPQLEVDKLLPKDSLKGFRSSHKAPGVGHSSSGNFRSAPGGDLSSLGNSHRGTSQMKDSIVTLKSQSLSGQEQIFRNKDSPLLDSDSYLVNSTLFALHFKDYRGNALPNFHKSIPSSHSTIHNHSFTSSHSKYNYESILNVMKQLSYPHKLHSQKQSVGMNSAVYLRLAHRTLSKRSTDLSFNDPAYPKQWHLHNIHGMDINVTGVWQRNITGNGITVSVVDDGLEWKNPDLRTNYNHKGSWDMNDDDPDPTPSASKTSNHHGTRCAGEIAAVANNGVCGVGVAYGAQISGLRVLDGVMTDSMEAEAFNKKMDINDIYSCSWGPDDDGRTVDGPHIMAAKAMKYGVDFGRQGFGSIFVVASGNGGENKDNCNFDGYANSIYTLTIGAVDEDGGMPYYAEECASMLGVTFSSGTMNKRDIVTTDWTVGGGTGCTERHTGTSAAAPLAAAMIALMLEARPCLSWRDVQYLIILTGQKVDVHLAHWQENGAGLSHSHKHGFGLLNAWRLVNAARVWEMVPWLTSYSYAKSDQELSIPKGAKLSLTVSHIVAERDIRGLSLFVLENVQLTLSLSHPCRGQLEVRMISPAGTMSVLATPRPKDNSTEGFKEWTFTTVRCWGESPTGNWTFQVIDHDETKYGQGKVTKWRLTLFGTPMTREEFVQRQERVRSAMSGKYLHDNYTLACPPPPKYESVYAPVSERTLKILILSGAFCLVMAIYETFEYIFCYDDEKKEMARNRRLTLRAQRLASQTGALENGDAGSPMLPNGDNVVENDDEEEDEEDVFNISETSRLLQEDRGRRSVGANVTIPETIPLSTFSTEEVEPRIVSELPAVGNTASNLPSVHSALDDLPLSGTTSSILFSVDGVSSDLPFSGAPPNNLPGSDQ